jgi:mannose-6-phosphate isomerase-like protein (cupin superfamily)
MNTPTSSIRGFFEILMPGVFLVLNAVVTLYVLTSVLAPKIVSQLNAALLHCSSPALAASLLIAVSYPVGVVLRLLKNAKIDGRSAAYIRLMHPGEREAFYVKDEFFFNNWMKEKVKERLPSDAAFFYQKYWADKDTGSGTKNTTFFNFCKTIVAKNDPQSGIEIYGAEALSRFLAGSYYALQASVLLMLANAICAFTCLSPRYALLPLIIIIGYLYLLHVILSQYRLLRCKEVDIVFNACFANREHFDRLFQTTSSRSLMFVSGCSQFDTRLTLLKDAWLPRQDGTRLIQSVALHRLISFMKTRSTTHPYLSSMYFAGAEVDHPFFLENNKVAIGLSVLPEDAGKSAVPKRHPLQSEIIVVIQGALTLHHDKGGIADHLTLTEDECFIIDKGVCHWITSIDKTDAAYLFIKTNPSEEPRSASCEIGAPTE